jgi:outer membrane autotransporter protein
VVSRSGRGIRLDTEGSGLAASLEAGYPLTFAPGWVFEPQAQIVGQRLALGSGSDGYAAINFEDAHSLAGRIGARLAHTWLVDPARPSSAITAWLRADVWHETQGDPITAFSSDLGFLPFRAELGETWADLRVGVSGSVRPGMALHANVGAQRSFDNRARGYDGKIGLRVSW